MLDGLDNLIKPVRSVQRRWTYKTHNYIHLFLVKRSQSVIRRTTVSLVFQYLFIFSASIFSSSIHSNIVLPIDSIHTPLITASLHHGSECAQLRHYCKHQRRSETTSITRPEEHGLQTAPWGSVQSSSPERVSTHIQGAAAGHDRVRQYTQCASSGVTRKTNEQK